MKWPLYALSKGTLLRERYQICEFLEEGCNGIVYRGKDLRDGKDIAIKEFFPSESVYRYREPSVTWRIEKTEVLEKCRDFLKIPALFVNMNKIPGIVEIRDCFQENDTAYMIMEWIDGMSLEQRLCKGQIGWEECKRYMFPLMKVIEDLHEQGIFYKDMKPENIFITKKGEAVLLDLEEAQLFEEKEAQKSFVITSGFSPIEQYIPCGKVGPWSDVYAMSATIYYCLTGDMPKPAFLRRKDKKLDVELLKKAGMTEKQILVLEKGMAVYVEERWKTMDIFRENLEEE